MSLDRECLGNSNWGDDGIGIALSNTGFSVNENGIIESYGQFGHEVSVTYFGPTRLRYNFLALIFGIWTPNGDPMTDPPCWDCTGVCPFVPLLDTVTGTCLYPDTYSIADDCGNPRGQIYQSVSSPCDPMEPYVDCCPAVIGSECCFVTINYRFKETSLDGMIGRSVDPGGNPMIDNCACEPTSGMGIPESQMPLVPDCTFVEFRISNDFSVLQTPAQKWTSGCTGTSLTSVGPLFPVHVLTTTYDIIWSNVPAVNYRALRRFSGTVNEMDFLGYPPGSVLCIYRDTIRKMRFDCQVTHDVRLQLIAKTAEINEPDPNMCANIECGLIGLWNRTWQNEVCDVCNGLPKPPGAACTDPGISNWHLAETTACNADGGSDCIQHPFYYSDLTRLFQYGMACCDPMSTTFPLIPWRPDVGVP